MPAGQVKWFDPKKGYGFITSPDGRDVFIHFTAILNDGFKTLESDAWIESLDVGVKCQILLNPKVWRACGKTLGWGKTKQGRDTFAGKNHKREMHRFIDYLCEYDKIDK